MHFRLLALLGAGVSFAVFAACGPREHAEDQHAPRAVQVQQWNCGADLASRKKIVVDALHAAQATDLEIALVLAMLMQETTTGAACDRDTSKDGAGDARNFSAYNLNKYCLRMLKVPDDQMEGLNDDQQLGKASTLVLQALRQMGEDRMLNLHRGGQAAYEDGTSYGAADYRAQMRAVQAQLINDRGLWTSGMRVGGHLDHV